MAKKKITERDKIFIQEYLISLKPEQSALRAGYSPKTAAAMSYNWVSNRKIKPAVYDAIRAALDKRAKKAEIDAMWVLNRLVAEAEADIGDLYDKETGKLKPVHDWPLIWRQGLVAGIDTYEQMEDKIKIGDIMKVKISDRVKRLEMIGKHININAFQENVNVTGIDQLSERLDRAKRRGS